MGQNYKKGEISMDLEILKNEEKRMNLIMFLFVAVIPVSAFGYVMLFNNGTARDTIVLVMPVCSLLVKAFEKVLGKYAKYLYISILPVIGVVTIAAGSPAAFGAMAEAYFLVLFLCVPYYDLSVIKVCTIVTIVPNIVALFIFREQYLAMYTMSIWFFVWIVYILAVVVAVFIVTRARSLFQMVETKEHEVENLLNSVRFAFDDLQQSTEKIYESLHNFEESSTDIAASTAEISNSAYSRCPDFPIKQGKINLPLFNPRFLLLFRLDQGYIVQTYLPKNLPPFQALFDVPRKSPALLPVLRVSCRPSSCCWHKYSRSVS